MRVHTIAAFLALAASALGQTDTGSLTGRVVDPSGAGVASAAIQLRNVNSGAARDGRASADGLYQFNLLPPGVYEVTAQASGFRRFVDSEVRIQVAQPTIDRKSVV